MKTVSITYRKRTGEYQIRQRDPITGKTADTYANHLTDEEKQWIRSNARQYQDPYVIQWLERRYQ